ncbi:hypothetical protein LRP30_23595 [Bradyrhizobium sp. C-145]|uniref:hypothetical protein n=1 Tax=Bradyrhizobium sp. C-145 TaxID=574727 RepID=UPI00201B8B3D|nr:hypothetical protein [Bradyrhizobium sp. C-145]UQR60021.1 hypothetical protein LRP30_23595 [Bradyrhizobium sp. C-145]
MAGKAAWAHSGLVSEPPVNQEPDRNALPLDRIVSASERDTQRLRWLHAGAEQRDVVSFTNYK